ncbi:hypothetical protein TNIN_255231 [Trichonephila inaurata madagascariensis]|uniref:Uncharacterized protein n=1 Tax=Trichonephila inaurata madagascariensis TaxID=2747483 RepID=A0A8X6YKK6_9ARAC|nr:hypothetical protein TNIN_255231 [Trichonephila inaurata madagascariensis]
MTSSTLIFLEICSRAKSTIVSSLRSLPVHDWCSGKRSRSATSFRGSPFQQTAFSKIQSGHLRCLKNLTEEIRHSLIVRNVTKLNHPWLSTFLHGTCK